MIKLALKYALFAAIATAFNLAAQWIVDRGVDLTNLKTLLAGITFASAILYFGSLFAGTMVGLVVKYILDKKYIFNYVVKTKSEDARKFLIYSVMGIATTVIFWGFQTGFHLVFKDNEYAKYVGAIIGLTIGYFVKYQLDKRFVFNKKLIEQIQWKIQNEAD